MIEIIPQNIEMFSINKIEKLYGSKVKFFNNNIEIYNLNIVDKYEFYMIYSCNKDIICSFYSDKYQYDYMSEFEYLSDENIFNLDIEMIYYKWRLLNFLRIKIYSESIIDIDKDKNFLKMVYAISSSVEGYIYVTEFIPNIRSGLYPSDRWSGFLSRL